MSSTMSKEEHSDRKIKRLFKAAGHSLWYHHMGPKKFQTWIHCLGLIVKQVYRLSYRRVARYIDEHYNISMHWTTLQKAASRLPKSLWQSLLAATITFAAIPFAAVDGTGFARSGPSNYFLKRIDRDGPIGRPIQLITMVDIQKRRFISGICFAKPHGEAKRVPILHQQSNIIPDVLLMDKGFDAEWLHQWLNKNGTFSIAPVRKNCRRGKHRKLMRDCMDWHIYWQRNIVESLFSALKRLYGDTVKSRKINPLTAEIFCRLIAYNLGLRPNRFSTEPLIAESL